MPTAGVAEPQRELVLFRLGDGWFAADIQSAREIVPFEGVTRLPSLATWALGVMRIRGDVVPVADLCARLSGSPRPESLASRASDRVIVVELGNEVVGMLVDAVSDVLRVPASQVQPPPPLLAAGTYIEGVVQVDDRLVTLIDVAALFDGSEDARAEVRSAGHLELVEAGDETPAAPTARDDAWLGLVKQGTANAMVGLSQMIGREAELHELRLRPLSADDLTSELAPDEEAVAIHLGVTGAATDIVMIYERDIACSFADLLMWQPVGTTSSLGEIERSALSEMGNVLSGFFLNALADATGLNLMPSPPTMVVGPPSELTEILERTRPSGDHTYLSEAVYGVDGREIAGSFFVAPSIELVAALEAGLASQEALAA